MMVVVLALLSQVSLDLESYLPKEMAAVYRAACGVKAQLYPWQVRSQDSCNQCTQVSLLHVLYLVRESGCVSATQAECLMRPGVLRGRNLVFSAPTSAGKTIVYEVLALRRLTTTQRPFMLVLPTVALCEQKVGTPNSTQCLPVQPLNMLTCVSLCCLI